MTQLRTSLLAAVCLFVVSLAVESNAVLTNRQKDTIKRLTTRIRHCAGSPGFVLTMVDLSKSSLFELAMGVDTDSNGKHLSPNDVFCIGDGTMAFSAVLLGILMEANNTVSWDMPVERIIGNRIYLPDLYRTEHLSLKDIFTMRSGLAGMDILPIAQPFDQKKLISNLRYSPVAGGFRERVIANRVLFALVQEATEALGGGETWYNLMKMHVLNPLQMDSTVFAGQKMAAMRTGKSVVNGPFFHQRNAQPLADSVYDGLEMIAPASSMCTTARDMKRWFQFLLHGGMADGQTRLITEETLNIISMGTQARPQDGNPENEGYKRQDNVLDSSYIRNINSLGFINGIFRGYQFLSQDGSLAGVQTLATIIPEKNKAAFVSLMGSENPKSFAAKVLITTVLLDMMLEDQTWLQYDQVCGAVDQLAGRHHRHMEETRRTVGGPHSDHQRPLQEYVATYKNYAFGDVVVKFNETGSNRLIIKYGKITYRLDYMNRNDTFEMKVADGPMWYSTNADWYHQNKRLFAVFGAHPIHRISDDDDDEERDDNDIEEEKRRTDHIVNVTISGFDSHSNPVFAKNARRPYYEKEHRDIECSAPANLLNSAMAFWGLALMSLCVGYLK